ncbi:MAG: hypothetical protein LUF00_03660 [Lachnospiraceae bacterium]|nr:hypothetical protein [Lachnospiraceae bacterium]
MKYLLVPVIMAAAIVGTVGIIKLIQHFFPDAGKTMDKTDEWIKKHK